MTGLSFNAWIVLGGYTAPKTVFTQLHGKQMTIWGPISGFNGKHVFKMNLMHGPTNNISHVPIWHGRVCRHLSRHKRREMTSLNMSLNLFHLIWNNPISNLDGSFFGEPQLSTFALYFNLCVIQEDSITANILGNIFSSKFYKKKYHHLWCIQCCKCQVCASCILSAF